MFRPTNPPIHPPTHQKKHSPMSGEFFTDSKSSNRIELSQFVQFLLNFYWFGGGGRPLKGGCVGGWGWRWVWATLTHTRTCTCTHARAHTCIRVWHHREFPMGYPNGSSHLHEIIMSIRIHVCARTCMRARARARVCGGCPHPPTPPSTHPPTPQGGNTQNSEISIYLDLIEIIRFCLKILYLWTLLNSSRLTLITLDTPPPTCPAPWTLRSQNLKNAIKR